VTSNSSNASIQLHYDLCQWRGIILLATHNSEVSSQPSAITCAGGWMGGYSVTPNCEVFPVYIISSISKRHVRIGALGL
jgi:hypothetical protein